MEMEDEADPASVRRTLTLRNSAARQVAVNFMPSRQLSYNTLRLRRAGSEHGVALGMAEEEGDADRRAEQIVRGMEQHQRLMEDDPAAEQMRREALRDLPQGMTMKRTVRAKLSASVSLRSKRKPISMWKRMKYRISFASKRMRERVRDVVFSVELWYEAIRDVEGHFGSAVGSYFYFLRWLFALDAALALLLLAFVVVPQALHDAAGNNTAADASFTGFLSGNMFEDTVLFYGHYHHGDIATPGPLAYNMPFAYFFTMLCLYLVVFAVLCFRTAYSYRRNFIETADGLGHAAASKLFCGWDFGIATAHAARLTANSIFLEFKELLSEQDKSKVVLSAWVRLGRVAANAAVTALVLAAIAALQYALWALLAADHVPNWEIVVSLVVTATVSLCPLAFNLVARLEFYSARTALWVALARTWLLDAATLLLLLLYWSRSAEPCWETRLGQEAYRLVLLDALVSLLLVPLVEFLRALAFKWHPSLGAPEFNIAYNSLTVLYNQAALWLGLLFAPLLAAAVAVKFFLLFYVKREVAVRACQPARKVWRAAQTQTIFYVLVTLSLFASLFALGSIFFWKESESCGPFVQYAFVYEVVSEGVLRLGARPAARRALAFLTKPGAQAFMLLALCVAVYYVRARARAQRAMAALLRQMLLLQAKDKDFLLQAIAKVSNGEWHYSPKEEEEGPDSHTWRYLRQVRKPSNADFSFGEQRGPAPGHAPGPAPGHAPGPAPRDDGDTDSSFSWQGSSNCLNQSGDKRWL